MDLVNFRKKVQDFKLSLFERQKMSIISVLHIKLTRKMVVNFLVALATISSVYIPFFWVGFVAIDAKNIRIGLLFMELLLIPFAMLGAFYSIAFLVRGWTLSGLKEQILKSDNIEGAKQIILRYLTNNISSDLIVDNERLGKVLAIDYTFLYTEDLKSFKNLLDKEENALLAKHLEDGYDMVNDFFTLKSLDALLENLDKKITVQNDKASQENKERKNYIQMKLNSIFDHSDMLVKNKLEDLDEKYNVIFETKNIKTELKRMM